MFSETVVSLLTFSAVLFALLFLLFNVPEGVFQLLETIAHLIAELLTTSVLLGVITSIAVIAVTYWAVRYWWQHRSRRRSVYTVRSQCCSCGDYYERFNAADDTREVADISVEAFESELKKHGIPARDFKKALAEITCCKSVYDCPCRLRGIRCNKHCTPSAHLYFDDNGCQNQLPEKLWNKEKNRFYWHDAVYNRDLAEEPLVDDGTQERRCWRWAF
jgi:hypothetical protein